METYHKIQTLFKRDMDGTRTGQKGKMIRGEWTTPELEYLANNEWEFTEKVDGTNIRIELHKGYDFYSARYGGRTDNAVIPKPLVEHLEATFPTYPSWRRDITAPAYYDRYETVHDWMNNFDQGGKIILFGEGYGPKIQGGGKYRDDHSFVLFDVKIGDFWLKRKDVDDIAAKLDIESVPVIGTGTLQDAINLVSGTPLWAGGDGGYVRSVLHSKWGDFEAEGIVARPVVPLFNRKGERIITKIKGVDFRG